MEHMKHLSSRKTHINLEANGKQMTGAIGKNESVEKRQNYLIINLNG